MAKASGEDVRKQVGVAAVGIEVRIENGDMGPDCAGGERSQQCGQFFGGEAAWVGAVDRGHVLGIEDVEGQPGSGEMPRPGDGPSGQCGRFGSVLPDLAGCNHGAENLAGLAEVFVVAAADVYGVGCCEIGAAPVKVGHRGPVPAHRGCEVLTARLRQTRLLPG